MKKHLALLLVSSLALGSYPLLSAAEDPAATAPSQKMQRYPRQSGGPGMMGGYGGGCGMGPGMMMGGTGYGMGPGMMGGMGMGPGMMGGYGMGMGPGMMGGYWGSGLDLTEDQEAKISRIQDETRKQHWELMGRMMDQQARLRDLYTAPKRDAAAIDEAYETFGQLQQQMYDSSVESHKRMEAVLTKEQQEKLRTQWRKGWAPQR